LVYKIKFKESVFKDLAKFPKEEARRILDKIDNELSSKAKSQPALKGKFKGMKKFRVGVYRVIFVIISDEVLILRIAHRKEVYKK